MNDKVLIMKSEEKHDDKIQKTDWDLEDLEKMELKEFDEQLKKYSEYHKMYMRIPAVKMVKLGETRIKVGNILNVDRQTVGRWVKI